MTYPKLSPFIPWLLTIGGLLSGTALATGHGLVATLPALLALTAGIVIRHLEKQPQTSPLME